MNTKVIVVVVALVVLMGGIGAFIYTDGFNNSPEMPDNGDDGSDGTDNGTDDGNPLTEDKSVVASITYNAENVAFSYEYLAEDDHTESERPTEAVLHTGESPEDGTIIYEVEDPQSSVEETFSFEDFNVAERENLPETAVTVTYEDGSTEVITQESIDGSGPYVNADITVERNTETAETTITAREFNAEYLIIQSGEDNEYGRIDEEGGSVTLSPEEVYAYQNGNTFTDPKYFQIIAHTGSNQQQVDSFTGGLPEPNYEILTQSGDKFVIEIAPSTTYPELQVSGITAVGTDDLNAELEDQSNITITEETSIVVQYFLIVEIETESGYTIEFQLSP